MKTVIHVNQHIIKANRQQGARVPPLTVKTYKGNRTGSRARLIDAHGVCIAEVVYSPDKPLSCGATVWIETYETVEVE